MKRITLLLAIVAIGVQSVLAQTREITGTVTSAEDGSTIPGVSVSVKGTTLGTITDFDGRYFIKVSPSATTLVFSFVGMKNREAAISGPVISVSLEPDVFGIDEVIVSAVASSTPVKKMSISVSKVGEDVLEMVPGKSAASALQGKVAGVTVINSSGNPGQSSGIRLRGSTALTGSQQPLILIDGVIFEGELADVNVDDLTSFEVVKGAAASALYGSRAGAGVIVITSKRGGNTPEGETEIRVRNEFGFQELGKKMDLASHHPYKLAGDYGSVGNYTKYAGVTYPDGYTGGPSAGIVGTRQVEFDGYIDNPYGIYHDYQEQIFTKGQFYTNYVSISDNAGKTKIFASFENNRNEGIVWSTDGSYRQNFRFNMDHQFTEKIKISTSTFITKMKIDLPEAREALEYGGEEAYGGGQGTAFYNLLFMEPDVNLSMDPPGGFLLPNYYYLPNPWSPDTENPKHALHYEQRALNRRGVVQNITGTYHVLDWMTLEANYSFDRRDNDFTRIRPKGYQMQALAYLKGQIYKYDYAGLSQTFQGTVNLNRKFGMVVAKGKLSYLYENRKENQFSVTGNDLAAANITSLDGVTGTKSTSSAEYQEIARNYFGILDLDVKDRYLVSMLYRYDGSSLFGENNRWNPYYRLSGAYRVTEDVRIPGIEELKIRAAVGSSGQRPGFNYQYEAYDLDNGSFYKYTIGNKNLKPSETIEKEVGLTIGFLEKFELEVIASRNETKDAFVEVPLSASTGYVAQWRNAATLSGKALEATLGVRAIANKHTGLKFNFAFDRVRQKVKKLDAPPFQVGPGANEVSAFYLKDNETFGIMYGYDWVRGLDQMRNQLPAGQTIDRYTVNADGYVIAKGTEGTVEEKPIALDQDHDKTSDFVRIADMNPDFNLAFTTTFRWKNLTLNMLWHWKQGGDIYNLTKQWLYRDNRHGDMDMYGVTDYKKKSFYYYQALYNASNVNSRFVEDGTFLKLRELSIYYVMDKRFFSSAGVPFIKGMKAGILGRNLLTFTKYSGWDPEVSAGTDLTNYAMDIFNYPNFRTYTFSLEFTL
ncbi:MAG: SusC/RagA family TonB-linked outer membrane protein [Mangrovibacterium sp.]|nr:SusC/RagA family TonB-linked outer membrane protein [Mangrovibacterium sp.]